MSRMTLLAAGCAALCTSTAHAQGMIWRLPPEDGTWVKYEGTYNQVEARPDSSDGNLEMEWIRHVWIKSVGQEDAVYKGESVPCGWVEIKIQTGRLKDGAINTGSVGERIYKVLIPEKYVIGSTRDSEGIPVMHLPIVRGYRKTNDRDPTPREIKSGVLQVYPIVSLIRHYKDMEASPEEVISVGQEDVSATPLKGFYEEESRTTGVVHESTLWRSDAIPFGLAQWHVKITQDTKGEVEQRSEFSFASEIEVHMTARQIGADARTELVIE